MALIKTVTECVSDPAPLPRWREGTYSCVEGMAQLTPVIPPRPSAPTPRDIPPVAAHRPAALPTSSVPRWSTTSRPTLPGLAVDHPPSDGPAEGIRLALYTREFFMGHLNSHSPAAVVGQHLLRDAYP